MSDYLTLGYQARLEEDLSRINVQEASLGLTFDRFSSGSSKRTSPYRGGCQLRDCRRPGTGSGDGVDWLGEAWSVFGKFLL